MERSTLDGQQSGTVRGIDLYAPQPSFDCRSCILVSKSSYNLACGCRVFQRCRCTMPAGQHVLLDYHPPVKGAISEGCQHARQIDGPIPQASKDAVSYCGVKVNALLPAF